MTANPISELKIFDVYDHGIPNLERLAIFVNEPCNLSEYCLLLGLLSIDGSALPIKDHMLWFGHADVKHGDWVIVYTASGTTTITPYPNSTYPDQRVLSVHWGKDRTIFQNRGVVPMLLRIDAMAMMSPPEAKFQGLSLNDERLRIKN